MKKQILHVLHMGKTSFCLPVCIVEPAFVEEKLRKLDIHDMFYPLYISGLNKCKYDNEKKKKEKARKKEEVFQALFFLSKFETKV